MQPEIQPPIGFLTSAIADLSAETRIRVSAIGSESCSRAETNVTRSLHPGWSMGSTTDASGLARFLSVDPALGNPHRPQSWNRYAYVENNPLRNTDPTGRCTNSVVCLNYGHTEDANGVATDAETVTAPPPPQEGTWEAAVDNVAIGAAQSAGEPYGGSYAFHYANSANVDSILSNGLMPNSFATNKGDLTPLQAQIDLALPPNRPAVDSVLRIDVRSMTEDGFEPPTAYQGIGRLIGGSNIRMNPNARTYEGIGSPDTMEMNFPAGVPKIYLQLYRGPMGLPGEYELLPDAVVPPFGGVVIY